jgi:hypothetical protein
MDNRLTRLVSLGARGVTPPLQAAAAAVFGALAVVRRARALHPKGSSFHATFRPLAPAPTGVALFDDGAEHPALVRFSRGIGLGERWPDLLGVAVKILDVGELRREQDLLMTSAGSAPIARHVFRPTRRFGSGMFSSVLPFAAGGRTLILGATVEGEPRPGARVVLRVAEPDGPWRDVAEVLLGTPLDTAQDGRLRFNVTEVAGGIRPVGLLNRLRGPAYAASQALEPAPGGSGP